MSTHLDFMVARASEARAEAEATTLDNVRERCLRSAAAWEAMAARVHRMERQRTQREAEKAAEIEARQDLSSSLGGN